MSRARIAGILATVLVAVGSLTGPLAAPAVAGYSYLCMGYSACAKAGMPASGYAKVNDQMFWMMYAGHNCTNYAAYRMVNSGLPNKRPWSGSGNAENWGLAMKEITDQTPTVGSIAWYKQYVWPAGSAGHVAYVEKVISPTEIIVSQDSWGGDFSWARITKSGSGWPSGFVHFNDLKLSNTAAPTISGLAKVGGVLTASAGTWSPDDVKLGYQWRANGANIAGATGSTFTLTPAQLDKVITVRVTATKLGYPSASAVSAGTAAVLPGELSNESAPAVSGTPVVDSTVVANPGTWYPKPDEIRYRWKADGVFIDGATSPTLQVPAELVDKTLTVRVVALRAGFDRVRVDSATTEPVSPGTFTATAQPTLTGTARPGETLTLAPGAVTPAGTATITWRRGPATVADATTSSYQLTTDDLGSVVRAWVTYERPGYTPLRLATAATARVKSASTMTVQAMSPAKGRARIVTRITADGVASPTGTVTIRSGGKVLAQLPVVDGVARTTLKGLGSGKRTFRLRYAGSPTTTYAVGSTVVAVR